MCVCPKQNPALRAHVDAAQRHRSGFGQEPRTLSAALATADARALERRKSERRLARIGVGAPTSAPSVVVVKQLNFRVLVTVLTQYGLGN